MGWVMPMHKEELVLLHLTLFYIKRFFEEVGIANGHFREYDKLGIKPVHIHKSKAEHKKAVFLLCRGISDIFKTVDTELLINNPKVKEYLDSIPEIECH